MRSKAKVTCPVQDSRRLYGRPVAIVQLPACADGMCGEPIECRKLVLFCCTENGYADDSKEALKWLVPGHVYTAVTFWVHSSSSQLELEEFPGMRFNPVMFTEWQATD